MVYNLGSNLPHFLQQHCLLCRCKLAAFSHRKQHIFGLCTFCHAQLPQLIHSCAICGIGLDCQKPICEQCVNSSASFNSTSCALSYEGNVPALIHQLKHQHDNAMLRLLADLLCARLRQNVIPPIDWLIATPMHWKKNLQRHNNHAWLLAKQLSQQLRIPLHPTALIRQTLNHEQKMLNLQQRQHNLDHAFIGTNSVKEQRIALIDDVITTGSTMEAMALALKQAGAIEVHCWAIARTPKHA